MLRFVLSLPIIFIFFSNISCADERKVKITSDLESVTVQHQGAATVIERNQNTYNKITPLFQKTSRACPPFCIQPMHLADGVETIGELEMLQYLKRISQGDSSVLVIDSRGDNWVEQGTIPGSINIHYKRLSLRRADEADIADILEDQFGATRGSDLWKFAGAKTLVLFCNGMWCGQSPSNIRALLRIGYPASKIKWYRGGMQDWHNLGLTIIKPE